MTSALDHDTVFRGSGDFHQSVNECGAIMADIDAGRLCPIGLVLTESFAPWDVFKNHVVLVWGYDVDGEQLTLHTYDCNKPGRDDIVITLDIDSPTPAKPITTNGTDGDVAGRVRGFFRLPYQHADPSPAYVDDASVSIAAALPTPIAAGATAVVAPWTPRTPGRRRGPRAAGTAWAVRARRTTPPGGRIGWNCRSDRSTRDGPSASATRPPHRVRERYGFAWQMVRESVHWFGHPTGTVTVEVGATAGETCTALAAQRAGLEQQLADVRAEIAGLDWSDPFTTRREAAAPQSAGAGARASDPTGGGAAAGGRLRPGLIGGQDFSSLAALVGLRGLALDVDAAEDRHPLDVQDRRVRREARRAALAVVEATEDRDARHVHDHVVGNSDLDAAEEAVGVERRLGGGERRVREVEFDATEHRERRVLLGHRPGAGSGRSAEDRHRPGRGVRRPAGERLDRVLGELAGVSAAFGSTAAAPGRSTVTGTRSA